MLPDDTLVFRDDISELPPDGQLVNPDFIYYL
jgi:hypothetical protein